MEAASLSTRRCDGVQPSPEIMVIRKTTACDFQPSQLHEKCHRCADIAPCRILLLFSFFAQNSTVSGQPGICSPGKSRRFTDTWRTQQSSAITLPNATQS